MTVGSGGCSVGGEEKILSNSVTYSLPSKAVNNYLMLTSTYTTNNQRSDTKMCLIPQIVENRLKIYNGIIKEYNICYHSNAISSSPSIYYYHFTNSNFSIASNTLPTVDTSLSKYKAKLELFVKFVSNNNSYQPARLASSTTESLEIELEGNIVNGVLQIDANDMNTKLQNITLSNYVLVKYTENTYLLALKELILE